MVPTKKLQKTVTAEHLSAYLSSQDDFALELFATSEATKAGLEVAHGGTYKDSVTGKHRQFDLRAMASNGNREICIAVECKALRRTFPLLISRVPRTAAESTHNLIYTYRMAQFVAGHTPGRCIAIESNSSLYPVGECVGKAITQVGIGTDGEFVANDGETYEKWSQAFASLTGLVDRGWRGYERSTSRSFLSLSIPVLVVSDETLWVADYTSDGSLLSGPRQEDAAELFVWREYQGPANHRFVATHLHVVTKSGLLAFYRQLTHDQTFFDKAFPHNHVPSDDGA